MRNNDESSRGEAAEALGSVSPPVGVCVTPGERGTTPDVVDADDVCEELDEPDRDVVDWEDDVLGVEEITPGDHELLSMANVVVGFVLDGVD